MFLSNTGIAQEKTTEILYPLKTRSGRFGYCNSTGTLVIQPRFEYAEPFKNGYAVVGKDGLYGVIDQLGKVIISLKYPAVELFSKGLFTLVMTKKEKNAWVCFWKWKVMPEWNILSTGNHGPFLSTKVPRAVWTIQSLPGKKILFKENRAEEDAGSSQYWKKDWTPYRNLPGDIEISAAGKALKVHDNLFLLSEDNSLKKVAGNVLELINDTSVLAYKGEQYFKLNITGKLLNKENYTMVDHVEFNVNDGKLMKVKKQRAEMYPFPTISDFIFKGDDKKMYIFPDLFKPLPVHIQDYKRASETATAIEIMENAMMIASVPNSKYFLVVSIFGEIRERRVLLLDGEGNWNTDIPAYEGLDQMLGNGEMLFTRSAKKGILTRDLEFKAFPFENGADPNNFSVDLFSGKDAISGKYGIYDFSKEKWQVTPAYSYIGNEVAPGVAIYSVKKEENGSGKEWYGLIDIKKNELVTPPVYDTINNDCRVVKTENGQQISFYIHPLTGKEYRE